MSGVVPISSGSAGAMVFTGLSFEVAHEAVPKNSPRISAKVKVLDLGFKVIFGVCPGAGWGKINHT